MRSIYTDENWQHIPRSAIEAAPHLRNVFAAYISNLERGIDSVDLNEHPLPRLQARVFPFLRDNEHFPVVLRELTSTDATLISLPREQFLEEHPEQNGVYTNIKEKYGKAVMPTHRMQVDLLSDQANSNRRSYTYFDHDYKDKISPSSLYLHIGNYGLSHASKLAQAHAIIMHKTGVYYENNMPPALSDVEKDIVHMYTFRKTRLNATFEAIQTTAAALSILTVTTVKGVKDEDELVNMIVEQNILPRFALGLAFGQIGISTFTGATALPDRNLVLSGNKLTLSPEWNEIFRRTHTTEKLKGKRAISETRRGCPAALSPEGGFDESSVNKLAKLILDEYNGIKPN